jgi:hypothetical protein
MRDMLKVKNPRKGEDSMRKRLLEKARKMGYVGYIARVGSIPACDVPGCAQEAIVDGKTVHGPWAYLCGRHFRALGVGIGPGKGQVLVLESEPLGE